MNITTDSDDNDKQNLAQDEDDSDLFQNAMQGVKPLAHDKILLQGPKPHPMVGESSCVNEADSNVCL